MNLLPITKTQNFVVQNVDKEILIYDISINKAFWLNETLATVYQACDGKTTFDELKAKTKFTDDVIYLSLDELHKQDFIDDNSEYVSPFAGMSRREVIRKVGLASMIALPVMTSLVAPTSASAASGPLPLLAVCTTNPQCSSRFCRPIFIGASGNYCCSTFNATAFPGAIFCAESQFACNFRCCSGSGANHPTFTMCSGGNSFACICNPV